MRKRLKWLVMTLAAILVLSIQSIQPSSAASQPLPGGKQYFVVALFAAKYNAAFGRLGEWTFNASTGTVSERYWAWNQEMAPVTEDLDLNREIAAYTYGCPMGACPVYTPKGFKGAGATRTGTFTNNGSLVTVTWPTGIKETYQIVDHPATGGKGAYAELKITSHTYAGVSQVQSRAFGSTRPFSQGAVPSGMSAWRSALNPTGLAANLWSQNWNAVTDYKSQAFRWNDSVNGYVKCASSDCVVNHTRTTWHSYLYFFGSATRKVSWYNMVNSMVGDSACVPANLGGHNWAMLQVIDDNGNFRGLVGIEASLYSRNHGSSIISGIWAVDN